MKLIITTGYKFTRISDISELKLKITKVCIKLGLKGTVILSKEGINLTLSGDKDSVDIFKKTLGNYIKVHYQDSGCDYIPFSKLKIKIKDEIVTFKSDANALNRKLVGQYIKPENWDEVISDKNVITIDTRNVYEVSQGTFCNSINPKTRNFQEFRFWALDTLQNIDKNQKVAMFCTGGVRCEKSTAFLMQKLHFKNVYHLHGGIIAYLNYKRHTAAPVNLWKGSCFVFDDRYSIEY